MQKYGQFGEAPLHELKHESKMRLFKTHSHISEWRGYEAGENIQNAETIEK